MSGRKKDRQVWWRHGPTSHGIYLVTHAGEVVQLHEDLSHLDFSGAYARYQEIILNRLPVSPDGVWYRRQDNLHVQLRDGCKVLLTHPPLKPTRRLTF